MGPILAILRFNKSILVVYLYFQGYCRKPPQSLKWSRSQPVILGWGRRYILDKSPVHCKANTMRQTTIQF